MKHLLTGVAMAAALAIAAPVWAQNAPAAAPAGAKPPAAAPAAPAKPATAAKPAAAKPMAAKAKKPMRRRMARMGAGDRMTEDLNRQELQRIMGGGAPAPASMSPGGNNPTSGAAGPFAPSAPPPPAQR